MENGRTLTSNVNVEIFIHKIATPRKVVTSHEKIQCVEWKIEIQVFLDYPCKRWYKSNEKRDFI